YDEARELFAQILSLDPENTQVDGWRKEFDEYDEKKRLEEQQRTVQAEIDSRARGMVREGLVQKKQGRYHAAIETLRKVKDIGSANRKVLRMSQALIAQCKAIIKSRLDPLLADAKAGEDAGDFPKAYEL